MPRKASPEKSSPEAQPAKPPPKPRAKKETASPETPKPKKERKPLTDSQKEALKKGQEKLAQRRAEKSKEKTIS